MGAHGPRVTPSTTLKGAKSGALSTTAATSCSHLEFGRGRFGRQFAMGNSIENYFSGRCLGARDGALP
jgi:hypothetical protein